MTEAGTSNPVGVSSLSSWDSQAGQPEGIARKGRRRRKNAQLQEVEVERGRGGGGEREGGGAGQLKGPGPAGSVTARGAGTAPTRVVRCVKRGESAAAQPQYCGDSGRIFGRSRQPAPAT